MLLLWKCSEIDMQVPTVTMRCVSMINRHTIQTEIKTGSWIYIHCTFVKRDY